LSFCHEKRQKLLTDEQWELIAPLFPEPRRRRENRGRPWASNRACFEGILWVLQTGCKTFGILQLKGIFK
jgi:transposase